MKIFSAKTFSTPKLLPLLVNFYGHLGLQLHPLVSADSSSKYRNYFRLLLNLTLNFATTFTSITLDPYLSKGYPIDPGIPWHVVAAFDTFYLYPINHILYSIYYLLFGQRIVHLLATSPHLVKVYEVAEEEEEKRVRNPKRLKLAVALGLFLLQHLLFLIVFVQVIAYYPALAFSSVLCLITDYLTFINPSLTLALLYYGQHGTYRALVKLHKSLQNCQNTSPILKCFQAAEKELQQMAHFCRQFYLLLSAPLALFTFATIFDAISSLCIGQAVPNWQTILSCALSLTSLLYLVHLNAEIRELLKRISDLLCRHRLKGRRGGSFEEEEEEEEDISLQIRLQETVAVYGPYYSLRFFHFSSSLIDYQFFAHSLLIIFNYSTLIIQTGPDWSFANVTDISEVVVVADLQKVPRI